MSEKEFCPDEYDKLWIKWKTNHLDVLRDSKASSEQIDRDMKRLFKILEEYTPAKFIKWSKG